MGAPVDLSSVASAIGNPARAVMLEALLDGQPHPAGELAHRANIAPSTAAGHLAVLKSAGFVVCKRNGRHNLCRLASSDVADALEALAVIAPRRPPSGLRESNRNAALKLARTCYDHLAGEVGVAITEALLRRGDLVSAVEDFRLTRRGKERLTEFGVDIAAAERARRIFTRACMDWSERRSHLAGALGAELCRHLFRLDWIRRHKGHRAVTITGSGREGLSEQLGVLVADDDRGQPTRLRT